SIFHAISAFCNAGFSTIHNGFYNPVLRFNYSIHLIIAVLIIFGGLGFNIMANTYAYFKRRITGLYRKIIYNEPVKFLAQELTFTSRIILYTTAFLLTGATILFFILEYNNILQEHKTLWGKIVTSFFLS